MSSGPASEKGPIRVIIVDDHSLLREGLRALIDQDPRFLVSGTASNAREALQLLATADPAVAIVDLRLGGVDGIECIKSLRRERSSLRFVVLSMFGEATYIERARKAGAHGFVPKSQAAEDLIRSLQAVAEGGTFFSGSHTPAAATEPIHARLTDRELLVLELIGAGYQSKAIAVELGIARKTVDCHKQNLRRKLGLPSGADLKRFARGRYSPVDETDDAEPDK